MLLNRTGDSTEKAVSYQALSKEYCSRDIQKQVRKQCPESSLHHIVEMNVNLE